MPISFPRPCRLFLFDLDGTLIDSRADLACSLNLALRRMDLPPVPEQSIVEFVGDGARKLVERTLRVTIGREPDDNIIQTTMALFQEEYSNHLLDKTRLYPNVKEGMDRLSWASFAVVSNKPERFSRRILEGLGLGNRFCIILGEDSVQRRKPDPEALLKAMDFCGASAAETAMVGDSPVDIAAGKAAGVVACGVSGGFRPKSQLEAAGCDLIVESLWNLADYFQPI